MLRLPPTIDLLLGERRVGIEKPNDVVLSRSQQDVEDDAAVTAGATVGPGARVSRSVLLGPVHVPADEDVTDEVRTAE